MNIGDYVRTHWGEIAKIIKIEDFIGTQLYSATKIIFLDKENRPTIKINDIKKYTSNIIDLIEVGDIITNQQGEVIIPTSGNIDELKDTWKIFKNIKSIVTKEQFESMEYKVVE